MLYGFDMGGTKIELAVFDADLNQRWQNGCRRRKMIIVHCYRFLPI